jgi:enterochelin esterase-like enzyme
VGLLVISANFLAGLVLVTLAAWGVAVWRGSRKRWVSSAVFGVLGLILSLATVADFVNAHYAYLPRVADVLGVRSWPTARLVDVADPVPRARSAHPRGAVVSVELPGARSSFGTHTALAYFPPQYFSQPSRRFPVVYLLHGSPGSPIDWFRAAKAADAGLAVARAGHPVILVAPRASRDWSDDSECVDRPKERIATYVVQDVVREVDARFRTIASRAGRALAGNSAGGYCALNLGLRNRNTFSAIVDMSGFDRPTHEGGLKHLFGNRPDLAKVTAANTPSQYVPTLLPAPDVSLWLDCGRSDGSARRDTVHIADALAARGFHVILRLRPGGHDYNVWRPALVEGLDWAAASLGSSSAP